MSTDGRSHAGASLLGRASGPAPTGAAPVASPATNSNELRHVLAEVKGQAQFLLYLADQLDDSLDQLSQEADPGHAAFLCKILGMYSAQLESKHQNLGDRIARACQEIYVAVREHDVS